MKSNGFFLTRDFDIDINEDIDFYDLEENFIEVNKVGVDI